MDEAAAAVAAGVTTDEIDRVVHEATVDRYFKWNFRFIMRVMIVNCQLSTVNCDH